MGAILPIVALMMTDMVASNIKNMSSKENESLQIDKEYEAVKIIEPAKNEIVNNKISVDEPTKTEETKDKEYIQEINKESNIGKKDNAVINKNDEQKIENKPIVEKPVQNISSIKHEDTKNDSILDYIDILNKDKTVVGSKEHNDVINLPNNETDHLEHRKINETYFRNPTKNL